MLSSFPRHELVSCMRILFQWKAKCETFTLESMISVIPEIKTEQESSDAKGFWQQGDFRRM